MAGGDTPCSSALHVLPALGQAWSWVTSLRGSPTDSPPLAALNVIKFSPGIGIIPFPCAHSWHCPWLSCCPGCWGLQPSGCSQCSNSLGTAQPRKRKGSSVLAIEAPPRESPQICDEPQCRDWLISLSPNPPWTGLSVKIPKPQSSQGIALLGVPNSQQKMLQTCPAQHGTTTSMVLPKWKPEQVWYPKSCFVPGLLHFCSSKLDVSHEPRVKFWGFVARIPCTEVEFLIRGHGFVEALHIVV